MSHSAQAQDNAEGIPGEVISQGEAPFSQTLPQMLKQDEPAQRLRRSGMRLPKAERVVPNVLGEELEDALPNRILPRVDRQSRVFSPTPFRGSIDREGHFLPRRSIGTTIIDNGGVPPSNAPQSLGAVSINGFQLNTTNGYIPPDTQGAVGTNYAMMFVNDSIGIYKKATGAFVSQITLSSFFAVTKGGVSYPRGGSYDPRVVFDRRSGHWFATDMEFGVNQANNNVILAVSRTDDPTGTWDKYVIPVGVASDSTYSYFTDYSTLGVDDNGVYIGATIFLTQLSDNTTVDAYAKLVAIPKASLVATSPSLGTVSQWTKITDSYGSPHPALNLDGSANGREWFVYSSNNFYSDLRYRTITWSNGTPSSSATTTLSTPAFGGKPQNAPALGTNSSLLINVGDMRVQMAIIRNNQLWTARNVGVDQNGGSSAANRTACEWLALSVSSATATLAQSGRVYDNAASNPRYYYYPSVTVTGQGHMGLGFSGSKSTEYVGAYTTGRLSTDPVNTTEGVLAVKSGNGSYTVDYNSGRNRWGDYSYTAVDPNDDQTLWTFQEYAFSANNWGVWGQQLKAPAPTLATRTTTYSGQGQQNQTNVSFQVAGTGFFDPGTGFANRLTASLSGTGISNVRTHYLSPTLIGIQCDIAAGATLGARSLTLINPDGQSVVLANALNVVAAAPVQPTITRTLTRVSGVIKATFTITNPSSSGTTLTNVQLTASTLEVGNVSTATTTALPITVGTGTLAAGASANVVLSFPGSVGTSGTSAILSVTGSHSTRNFGGSLRVTLP